MSELRTVAVVGAGLAGAKTVEALRAEGFDGRIVLFGEESHRPYERPPLSKGYLQGNDERETVFVHPEGWYAEHDVDLRLGVPVTGLDRHARELMTRDGDAVHYDRLVLATGATPRRLRLPGGDKPGVRYLRSVDDSDALRAAFRPGANVVVVGAGWIGLETAAAARGAGATVTVLESAELPLLRVLGPRMAQVFAGLHRENGVDLRFGVGVAAIHGDGSAVTGVELDDGSVIEADTVVVGVGVTPNVDLAQMAGLDVDDRCWGGASAWSTGRTLCTSRRWWRSRSSAARPCTTGCPTSSPTSTTSAWSTSATRAPTTTWRSAATSTGASSSRCGHARARSSPG
jgi:3-phenylpropionate/trans-cinnamate dioxygenase ferredoxin reductase subunit